MKISTRGRYALRVLIDLAEHNNSGYTAMKEVAQRQQISLKYLERILPVLVSAKLIEGIQGKGGGYRLTRKPEEYPVAEILALTEGDMAPVACLSCDAQPCERKDTCKTLPMWKELNSLISNYLNNKTIADLI
ncbi:MAG: Rrf2 family transcriptional regulator [Candidatus Riflebacteria bacterium]|nr:Rrf2 family transcriptional regulator [Candidatus Riflebacteria bacterium]